MPAPVASGWSDRRVGLAPTGKAPPCHGARGKRTFVFAAPTSVDAPPLPFPVPWTPIWASTTAIGSAHERADRGTRHRQHALPEQRVAQRLVGQAEAAPPIVERDAFLPTSQRCAERKVRAS